MFHEMVVLNDGVCLVGPYYEHLIFALSCSISALDTLKSWELPTTSAPSYIMASSRNSNEVTMGISTSPISILVAKGLGGW